MQKRTHRVFCAEVTDFLEGRKYTPKVFSALKTQVPQQAKRGLVYTKKLVFKGKKKENTYTPKSLQGVCGGPLRAVLVYRFWPPNFAQKLSEFSLPKQYARNSIPPVS